MASAVKGDSLPPHQNAVLKWNGMDQNNEFSVESSSVVVTDKHAPPSLHDVGSGCEDNSLSMQLTLMHATLVIFFFSNRRKEAPRWRRGSEGEPKFEPKRQRGVSFCVTHHCFSIIIIISRGARSLWGTRPRERWQLWDFWHDEAMEWGGVQGNGNWNNGSLFVWG